MRHSVTIRGSIDSETIRLLEEKTNALLGNDASLSFRRASDQIDAGALEVTASVIGIVSASLSIWVLTKQKFKELNRAPTKAEVQEHVENAAAEIGVVDAKPVEISNFKLIPDRKRTEPCVVTIKDLNSGRFYDALYYGKDRIELVEIASAS